MENNPLPSLSKPVVAVCGSASAELEEVAEKVRGLGAWDALLVRWPDARALETSFAAPAAGYVLVEPRGMSGAELAESIRTRAAGVPLLAVGGEPGLAQGASCWLARSPSGPFLGLLLGQLIPPTVVAQRRRKRDLILGISPAIKDVLDALDRLSASYAPVLITGESGTGKELVARALHFSGPRAAYPFLAVNCAAIPESLFESELFGHTRGAFTGATAARPGVFEAAGGGTVLLDEIGEMPLAMQAKLLRVLETGEITRLGTTESRRVDVRIVAATNRDLEEEVARKRFREDLYYRIRVYPLVLPPLRERPEDIPQLVFHHLALICQREQAPQPALTPAALEKLVSHTWPGNVRELVNVLQRAVLMAGPGAERIDAQHIALSAKASQGAGPIAAYHQAKADFEARYYQQVLHSAGGNISLAAKLAQKTRKEIYDALKRLHLEPEQFRSSSKPVD